MTDVERVGEVRNLMLSFATTLRPDLVAYRYPRQRQVDRNHGECHSTPALGYRRDIGWKPSVVDAVASNRLLS